MTKKKLYDYDSSRKLNQYFIKHFKGGANGKLLFTYVMQEFERFESSFCGVTVKSQRKIASIGNCRPNSIGIALRELADQGFIEYVPGDSNRSEGIATSFRRRPIEEHKSTWLSKIKDFRNTSAFELAKLLETRSFKYGGQLVQPNWTVKHTNRINSSKPNIQGDPQEQRIDKLLQGIDHDEFLICADYKQAEPTILQRLVKIRMNFAEAFPKDIYQELAGLVNISRPEAKKKVNTLAYKPNSQTEVNKWNLPQQDIFFHRYAKVLDDLKQEIWEESKPMGKSSRRHITTFGGTRIESYKNKPLKGSKRRIHGGTLLSWIIQGTVADIVNNFVKRVIEMEKHYDWQFLFQVHDSVYVRSKKLSGRLIENLMMAEAEGVSMPIKVDCKTYNSSGEIVVL